MEKPHFRQRITIENKDYDALICNNSDKKTQTLIITGHKVEYRREIEDAKQIQSIFKHQDGLSYTAKFIAGGEQLEIKPVHTVFTPKETYMLEKSEISFGDQLKETIYDFPYAITEDMLGPCISVTVGHKMSPDIVSSYLSGLKETSAVVVDGRRFQDFSQIKELPHDVLDFYTVQYPYQEEPPVATRNQVLINKIIKFRTGQHKVFSIKNGYTLLTRKYESNVVGTITGTPNNFTVNLGRVNFDMRKGCQNMKKHIDKGHAYFCDEKEYFKNCYVLTLPFTAEDGIYWSTEKYHTEITTSSPILVKNNRLYKSIYWLQDDKFALCEWTVSTPMRVSSE